ncbi:copper amine oxidase N-terminal domain-containing protein [Aneurinibacillus uraniidurans]|uniref:copper amine oxidase N-terminal domain-containing protein n=1 Tax=Aneurinibacillus uraniidurans TaxID=2966586 RepID=UPI00234A4D2A|nr:copper amine oxidase N-terminal domain-containing protein [Aneurinibacillus sp. B1]WCN38107.1 copper amine oxidase N-terminal domain-containing protein [Aneurinibacillus sp. B1]
MLVRYRQLVSGIIIGAVTATCVSVFGASVDLPIINEVIKFEFNEKQKELPEGYSVLQYQGHTYVPARFIAEELGAKVDWDENKKTVKITKSTIQPPVDSGVQYEKIPVTYTKDGIRIEIYSMVLEKNRTMFYLNVKNTLEQPIQLQQSKVSLVTEGNEKYTSDKVDTNILFPKDMTWYNDVLKDELKSGFILLPPLKNEEKKGIVHLEFIENDGSGKSFSFDIPITW